MHTPTTGLFGYTTGLKDVSLVAFEFVGQDMKITHKQLEGDSFTNKDNVMTIHMMKSKHAMLVAVIQPSLTEKNDIDLKMISMEKGIEYKTVVGYPAQLSMTPSSVFAFSNNKTGDNFLLVSTLEGMVTKINYCNEGIRFDAVGAVNIGQKVVDGAGDSDTGKMYYRMF
jgi:hypothetical protein